MDVASEAIFFKRLQESSDNKTMLLITHRYSLLALVDRIIVMDRGRIVADGPREQILRQAMGGGAPSAPPQGAKSPSAPHGFPPPKPPKARSQAHRLGSNAITFSDEAR
jgi:ATP-binding cassette subfamily C protein LapB